MPLAPGQLSLHGKQSHGWAAGCLCFCIRQGENNMALTTGAKVPWGFSKCAQQAKDSSGRSSFSTFSYMLLLPFSLLAG